jgi:predicted adenylyl cyclase CyaB
MDTREIEIKIKLDDAAALIKKVEGLGAKQVSEHNEYDVMYDDNSGNFKTGYPEKKQLRLRRTEKGNLLTYKEPIDVEHKYLLQRIEIQTHVEDFEIMDAILKKIGFNPYKVKEKVAVHYDLDGVILQFHKLPFLGDFLEIEAEEKELREFLPKIGLSFEQGINKSYNALFKDYCKEKNWPLDTPLTFEEERNKIGSVA